MNFRHIISVAVMLAASNITTIAHAATGSEATDSTTSKAPSATPNPSPREGSVDGWGKNGLKGQNKSAQGNALGIVHNQHSPRMGKRIIIPFTPFATLQWWAVILLPPSGAYPCCILSPRALPGAGISMPLRGVTNTHPQPLPKGGGLTPTPLFMTEGQKNIIPPPFGRVGVGFHHPFGRAGVGFTSPLPLPK